MPIKEHVANTFFRIKRFLITPKGEQKEQVLFKYLFTELLLYFALAFLFFFLIFFVNQILLMAEDILKKRVPFFDVLILIWYSLPFIIAQSAPFATLVGFLMCLGKMSGENEILILRALGKSFFTVLFPVLLCGMIISVASFFVNDYLLPLGTIKTNELYRKIILSNPGVELESYSIKRTQNAALVVGEVSGKNVSNLLLFDTDSEGNERIIVSGFTKSVDPPLGVVMHLQMQDAFIASINKKNPLKFDTVKTERTDFSFFESDIPSLSSTGNNPREMTSFDLGKQLRIMREQKDISPFVANSWELEYYKKFALPFGSLFFAFLSMPLALLFGKHNGQTIGLIVGIMICVLYWALLILGQTFGLRNGLNGFWAMWFPNTLIFAAGSLFFIGLIKK